MILWYILFTMIATAISMVIVVVLTIMLGGALLLPALLLTLLLIPYAACGAHNRRLVERILRHRHGLARIPAGSYLAELSFLEPLPRPGLLKLDTSNDIGAVVLRDDRLEFLGDGSLISLTREQIADIDAFGNSGELGYLGAKTRITFNERLTGQPGFTLTIREGVPFWVAWRRARATQEALIDWYHSPIDTVCSDRDTAESATA
jgi:hypothetical protein